MFVTLNKSSHFAGIRYIRRLGKVRKLALGVQSVEIEICQRIQVTLGGNGGLVVRLLLCCILRVVVIPKVIRLLIVQTSSLWLEINSSSLDETGGSVRGYR